MGFLGSVHQRSIQERAGRYQSATSREIERSQGWLQARIRIHEDSRIRSQESLRTAGQQSGLVRSSGFQDSFIRRDVRVLQLFYVREIVTLKADMHRDNARLERLALLKRGVMRGTRKQFAAGHLAYQVPLGRFGRYSGLYVKTHQAVGLARIRVALPPTTRGKE